MELTHAYLERYWLANPDATVGDFLAHFEKTNKQEKIDEENNERKRIEWYKAMQGHCYRIKLSSNSILYLNVDREPKFVGPYLSNISGVALHQQFGCSFSLDTDRKINYLWLGNPYETVPSSCECEEITEEEYNSIMRLFHEMQDKFKTIIDK